MGGLRGKVRAVMHLGMQAGEENPGCPLPAVGLRNNLSCTAHMVVLHITSNSRILIWLVSAVSKAVLPTTCIASERQPAEPCWVTAQHHVCAKASLN